MPAKGGKEREGGREVEGKGRRGGREGGRAGEREREREGEKKIYYHCGTSIVNLQYSFPVLQIRRTQQVFIQDLSLASSINERFGGRKGWGFPHSKCYQVPSKSTHSWSIFHHIQSVERRPQKLQRRWCNACGVTVGSIFCPLLAVTWSHTATVI